MGVQHFNGRKRIRTDRRAMLRTGAAFAGLTLVPRLGSAAAPALPIAHPEGTATAMTYHVEGRLLEVCTCSTLCPCWVGEDPDLGTCDSNLAWAIDSGTIEGVDCAGLVIALSVHIPGNVLAGNWKAVVYVDDRATAEQEEAILKVWTGELGGPIADLAGLITDVISVERATIGFDVDDGNGMLRIGDHVVAELAPFRGPTGEITTLNESVFSTIPGSPAYVGKASRYERDERRHGLDKINLTGHNAIQGLFVFEA